jgi:cation diffusion facilitator family transporter
VKSQYALAEKVAGQTFIGNIILTVVQIWVGFLANSSALIADAIHTGSDAFSTIIVLIGLKFAKKPPDEKHPYGHSRAETVAAKILSFILAFAGGNMFIGSVKTIWAQNYSSPGVIAFWMAVVTVIIKEMMYRYTIKVGNRIQSPALIASAWHHRSDALSSVAVAAGIIGARWRWPILDPVIAMVVSVLILKAAWDIFIKAVDDIMDAQVDKDIIEQVNRAVLSINHVNEVESLNIHRYGSELHVDITVKIDRNLSLEEGHRISHQVEESIVNLLNNATHFDVHLEPVSIGRTL